MVFHNFWQLIIELKDKKAFSRNKKTVIRTWRTEGTARISEKAKSEGWEVASATTVARAEPERADACFTNWSMSSDCFCSISISLQPKKKIPKIPKKKEICVCVCKWNSEIRPENGGGNCRAFEEGGEKLGFWRGDFGDGDWDGGEGGTTTGFVVTLHTTLSSQAAFWAIRSLEEKGRWKLKIKIKRKYKNKRF